jgi:prepilin-type N-terminal cleavage/methylation domain-containing protein
MAKIRLCSGFTLIELMIVIAIIGILATLAIPQFSDYKKRANDKVALAQVKDMVTAEEAYCAENGRYTTVLADLQSYGFKSHPEVTHTKSLIGTTAYTLTAKHMSGTGKTFTWISNQGGLQ